MNHQFRKKPVVIEAFQMTQKRRWDNQDWPNWLNQAWNLEPNDPGSLNIDITDAAKELLYIYTLEGNHSITWDDWIIQGVQGELYPCKPDIFEATYEPVLEESP